MNTPKYGIIDVKIFFRRLITEQTKDIIRISFWVFPALDHVWKNKNSHYFYYKTYTPLLNNYNNGLPGKFKYYWFLVFRNVMLANKVLIC